MKKIKYLLFGIFNEKSSIDLIFLFTLLCFLLGFFTDFALNLDLWKNISNGKSATAKFLSLCNLMMIGFFWNTVVYFIVKKVKNV